MKRIIAENLNWTLDVIPSLSELCLQCIVDKFEERPIFEGLTPTQKNFIEERLSPSLPLHITANLITDGVYWKRRCQQRWDFCDVSRYDSSWKRMFFERHLENIIEHFIPEVTEPSAVVKMVPLCKNYIKRLYIAQLLPPIKEPQNRGGGEDDDHESDLEMDDEYTPRIDHFDFGILLDKLTNLEELHLVYRVNQCGMHLEWNMFVATDRDCESLGKALKSCKTLKLFKLYLSRVQDVKCQVLVNYLLDHPSLTELDLSHNLISDAGAKALGTLLNRSKLETLNLCDNNINGPGAKAIAQALSKNSTLSSLSLRLNRLKDEGGQAICKALLNNKTLRHLNLGGNGMTCRTAVALSKVLVENNTLKSIYLAYNTLGEVGGKALAQAFSHNTSVTHCDIRLTQVDEQSVSSINQVVQTNRSLDQKKKAEKK